LAISIAYSDCLAILAMIIIDGNIVNPVVLDRLFDGFIFRNVKRQSPYIIKANRLSFAFLASCC